MGAVDAQHQEKRPDNHRHTRSGYQDDPHDTPLSCIDRDRGYADRDDVQEQLVTRTARVSFSESLPSPAQDVLGRPGWLARPPTARRHHHLDRARRADLHHPTRQPAAVSQPVPSDRAHRATGPPDPTRQGPNDAQAATNPRPGSGPTHRRRTPTQRRPRRRTQQAPTLLSYHCLFNAASSRSTYASTSPIADSAACTLIAMVSPMPCTPWVRPIIGDSPG